MSKSGDGWRLELMDQIISGEQLLACRRELALGKKRLL